MASNLPWWKVKRDTLSCAEREEVKSGYSEMLSKRILQKVTSRGFSTLRHFCRLATRCAFHMHRSARRSDKSLDSRPTSSIYLLDPMMRMTVMRPSWSRTMGTASRNCVGGTECNLTTNMARFGELSELQFHVMTEQRSSQKHTGPHGPISRGNFSSCCRIPSQHVCV